jgi:hypothetical protein
MNIVARVIVTPRVWQRRHRWDARREASRSQGVSHLHREPFMRIHSEARPGTHDEERERQALPTIDVGGYAGFDSTLGKD